MDAPDREAVAFGYPQLLKSLLVAAVLAVVLSQGAWWIAGMRRTATSRRFAASDHARQARIIEKTLKETSADRPVLKEWLAQSIRYHNQMEQEYLAAARWPWTKTPIDPGAPPLTADLFQ